LPLQSVETIAELPLLSAEDLKAPLRRVGEERYHHQHPFHRMMHQGELSPGQMQAWALNRHYKSCDRRTEDFGGCRCQVFLVLGDVTATDPVCYLSPDHHLIESARSAAAADVVEIAWSYRNSMG
jgi:hypothetical protein